MNVMSIDPAARALVLVVDDDPDIRLTLHDILENEGYAVVLASNGADALAALKLIKPRLILLDLSMPVMDGRQFRDAQQQDPVLAQIPTIVMTAADRVREKVLPMAVVNWIAKPVQLDDLLNVVARICAPAPSR